MEHNTKDRDEYILALYEYVDKDLNYINDFIKDLRDNVGHDNNHKDIEGICLLYKETLFLLIKKLNRDSIYEYFSNSEMNANQALNSSVRLRSNLSKYLLDSKSNINKLLFLAQKKDNILLYTRIEGSLRVNVLLNKLTNNLKSIYKSFGVKI